MATGVEQLRLWGMPLPPRFAARRKGALRPEAAVDNCIYAFLLDLLKLGQHRLGSFSVLSVF